MADTLEQLAERACALTVAQRAALAELLLASLDEGPDSAEVLTQADSEQLEGVWDHELRQRIARFERGETGTFPAAEVFAEARRRLRRRIAAGMTTWPLSETVTVDMLDPGALTR